MDVLHGLIHSILNNGDAALLSVGCGVALISLASSFIWSRQWYLLPIPLGLLALTGFLLNPLADSRSAFELRQILLGPDFHLAACVLQIILSAASFAVGLRLVAQPENSRWKVLLASLCCVPQPVVVLSMLLIEQQWLSAQFGARPEWVGTVVPLLMLAIMLGAGAVCWLLPNTWLALCQLTSALLLGVASCLFTTTANALPLGNQAELATHAVYALVPAALLGVVCLAIGIVWERLSTSRAHSQRLNRISHR
ncbi:hypothetical protein DTL42_13940 [Bremerella cremea]|uniref:Uncharacterized protein n=1 Tax=Bremerella cremea TaxID=1031537 RepID=A0A368KPS1_9BACT|nr:hypothetical protein [Bremerella cremea]RCS47621.1 hypothetical protein DTL42_13940 [Bremerella cremea]